MMPEQLSIPGTEPDRPAKATAAPPRIIAMDPPWGFADKLPGPGRGAEKHYRTMGVPGIVGAATGMLIAAGVTEMPSDCTLLLWRVASMQGEAFAVATALGFTIKSEIVWLKRTSKGRRWFGMGRQVRMEHEVCLIATRGKGAQRLRADVRSTFETDDLPAIYDEMGDGTLSAVFSAEAMRKHSEKPRVFFDIVERLYEGPYVELFARQRRLGWTTLGDEIPATVPCVCCGQPVEPGREVYAQPTCYTCLPPPPPLPVAS